MVCQVDEGNWGYSDLSMLHVYNTNTHLTWHAKKYYRLMHFSLIFPLSDRDDEVTVCFLDVDV